MTPSNGLTASLFVQSSLLVPNFQRISETRIRAQDVCVSVRCSSSGHWKTCPLRTSPSFSVSYCVPLLLFPVFMFPFLDGLLVYVHPHTRLTRAAFFPGGVAVFPSLSSSHPTPPLPRLPHLAHTPGPRRSDLGSWAATGIKPTFTASPKQQHSCLLTLDRPVGFVRGRLFAVRCLKQVVSRSPASNWQLFLSLFYLYFPFYPSVFRVLVPCSSCDGLGRSPSMS